MGKALVVKGLEVTNPIGYVTLEGADPFALSKYYANNTSITNEQKESLNTFVRGLIENNLWDKLYYFYPMIGTSIEDMILDCIDTENEDLFKLSGTTGLSVNGSYMEVDSTRTKDIFYPVRVNTISPSNISIVMACGNPYCGSPVFMDLNNGKKRVDMLTNSGGGNPMSMSCGLNEDGTETVVIKGNNLGTTILERVVCATVNNGHGTIWNDKTKYAEGNGNTEFNFGRTDDIFYKSGGTSGKFAFYAMASYMNESEWGKFYDLLLAFLKATGKHS